MTRPTWDEYFLELAKTVSLRADCTRRKCGAVLVKDHRVVATGYNGGPARGASCLKGECPRGRLTYDEVAEFTDYESGPGRCIAIHAETNCLLYSSLQDRAGATIYITDTPCPACLKTIGGSGVDRAVWPSGEWNRG